MVRTLQPAQMPPAAPVVSGGAIRAPNRQYNAVIVNQRPGARLARTATAVASARQRAMVTVFDRQAGTAALSLVPLCNLLWLRRTRRNHQQDGSSRRPKLSFRIRRAARITAAR